MALNGEPSFQRLDAPPSTSSLFIISAYMQLSYQTDCDRRWWNLFSRRYFDFQLPLRFNDKLHTYVQFTFCNVNSACCVIYDDRLVYLHKSTRCVAVRAGKNLGFWKFFLGFLGF